MTKKKIEARYKKVLKWRSGKHPKPFKEIGDYYGVSKQRAFQVYENALKWRVRAEIDKLCNDIMGD